MLKRKRKLTAMLLAIAVMIGGLQQSVIQGVKVQAAAKTNVTKESQAVPATGSAIDDDELPRMNISIKQGGSKKIKLNWNAYEGADYYCVFYVKGSFTKSLKDEENSNKKFVYNKTKFTLKVNCGQKYSFCVVAYSSEDVAIARTDKLTGCIPKKNSVRFTRLNSRKVKLSWSKSAGAKKYIIYKKINNKKYKKLAETKKLKYNDGKVRAGKRYKYYVAAVSIYNNKTFKTKSNAKGFAIANFVSTGHQKYSYNEMSGDIKQLVNTYSDYVKVKVIGKSNDKRNIYDVVIGNPKAKKTMLVVSSIHAREYMTAQLCMAQIEHYLKNYNGSVKGVSVKKTLNKIAIHYIPMTNPDGVTISQFGISKIRNKNLRNALYGMSGAGSHSSWKANARGVDLNRNFSYCYRANYGGKRGSEGYSGPYAESEPETKAVAKLIRTLKKNKKLVGTVNYHAMGSIAFGSIRDKTTESVRSTTTRMYNLARGITGYSSGASYEKGSKSAGELREYTMYNVKIPSITLEIGIGGCPLSTSQFGSVWGRNYSLVIREARLLM